MRAQLVDRGEAHHALGHLRFDRPVGIERIGHAVDDTRLEHRHRRLFFALCWRGRGSCASLASLKAEGDRALRRGTVSAGFARSNFGQASSNVAAGASAGSAGGAGGWGRSSGDNISGVKGSAVRAWARSRSFRDVEENSRLRRFGAGGASAGAGAASGAGSGSLRTPREAASSCHGGGAAAGPAGSAPAAWSAAGRSRVNRELPSPGAWPRATAAGNRRLRSNTGTEFGWNPATQPPRDAFQLPDSRPKAQQDKAGAARHHAGQDERVAETEFLDRNAEADRQQARQNQANADDQRHNHHRTHPRRPARNARRPPTPRYRHIVRIANRQFWREFLKIILPLGDFHFRTFGRIPGPKVQRRHGTRSFTFYQLLPICCVASGKLRHNSQLLGNGTALYGCRGMRP